MKAGGEERQTALPAVQNWGEMQVVPLVTAHALSMCWMVWDEQMYEGVQAQVAYW
jgi:hypothetical protein